MLNFKFMRHDRWANVLFIHWSVPSHLESILVAELNGTHAIVCSDDANSNDKILGGGDSAIKGGRFVLDRYKDGRAYVGLILLTEKNVGPIVGRSFQRLLVTHHGANIRTYVRPKIISGSSVDSVGVGNCSDDEEYLNSRGITFASLECDDAITAAGANLFGMPYKVTQMERTYFCRNHGEVSESSLSTHGMMSKKDNQALIRNNALSTREVDDLMCGTFDDIGGNGDADNNRTGIVAKRMGMKSARPPAPSRAQSLFGTMKAIIGRGDSNGARHDSKLGVVPANDDVKSSPQLERISSDDGNENDGSGYSIDCEWEVHDEQLTNEERAMADFFCERYHVYTKKYGLHWKGTVLHEAWPVQKAKIKRLILSNIDQYDPEQLHPILQHMANTSPDSVQFSEGVGPVDFQMLRPV